MCTCWMRGLIQQHPEDHLKAGFCMPLVVEGIVVRRFEITLLRLSRETTIKEFCCMVGTLVIHSCSHAELTCSRLLPRR